ncbi:MAG: outer membrane protein assembly factor BamA [Verrucomicrobia bacterium]|nr:outer membrane protein assembly factor BamA [Verrucomicrobiota bacterium]
MNQKLFCYALMVVLLARGTAHAQDMIPAMPVVAQIKIHHLGPAAASESMVRAHIRTREGKAYNPNTLDDDVRNLYKTGFFQDVRPTRDESASGIVITFVLQGKPIVTDITFAGNEKVSGRRLMKQVETVVGEPIDDRKLFFDQKAIEEYYQKKGYYEAKITYEKQVSELSGRGSVRFNIDEGPKIKIDDVIFHGVDGFTQKEMRRVMETKRTWWLAWLTGDGKLKRQVLEDDRELITEFFRNEGFLDIEVEDLRIETITPTRVVLHVEIKQGQKYLTGTVQFEGNTLYTPEELSQALVMKPNDTFSPKGFRSNRSAIYDMYDSIGYIDARINIDQEPNVQSGMIDLSYQIQEGSQSYVDKIVIQGNTRTKDKVIRRELPLAPGEIFDNVKVKVGQKRIERLDLFSQVEIDRQETDVPNRKDLVMTVNEKSTGRIQFGAGFSTVDNIVGFAEFSESNFDIGKWSYPYLQGGGQKLRVRTQVGARRQDYTLNFIEPWFLDQQLQLGVDLYHRDLNFQSDEYRETRTGGRVTLTKPLLTQWVDGLRGSVGYNLERVELNFQSAGITRAEAAALQNKLENNIPLTAAEQAAFDTGRHTLISPDMVAEETGQRLVSKGLASLAFDNRRGDPLFPSSGTLTKLEGTLTGGPFGLDTNYYALELTSHWYLRGLLPGHTIQVKGNLGVMDAFGDSERVPLFDRYFLGGAYNMRGYEYRRVGPRDTFLNGEPLGGNTYWQGTIEYIIPLIDALKFAVFYDVGNVYSDSYAFDQFGDFSDNWGLGLRLQTPLGPLQLDYALPLRDSDGYGRNDGQFQFGVTIREF